MPGSRLKKRTGKEDESDIDSESTGVVGTFETLRDEGGHFMHVGQHKKAIESFTKVRKSRRNCYITKDKVFKKPLARINLKKWVVVANSSFITSFFFLP